MRVAINNFQSAKTVKVPFIASSQKPLLIKKTAISDEADIYKFRFRSSQVLNVSLTNLQDNVDVKLFDRQGKLRSSSQNPGTNSEFIDELLTPNTYYLEVTRKGGETRYNLSLSSSLSGVHLASSDVNGDGILDIVAGAGAGNKPSVRVLSGWDGSELHNFFAFNPQNRSGVAVAAGDINRDGAADIIAAPARGQAQVYAFDGITGNPILSIKPYPRQFRGGVTVAVGDINKDGAADIITAPAKGGESRVHAFDGVTGTRLLSIRAFPRKFSQGVTVATGDINGDGAADIVTGPARGGQSEVRVFGGMTGREIRRFFVFDPRFEGGVQVASGATTGSGFANIVVSAGSGDPTMKVYDSRTMEVVQEFLPFGAKHQGGMRVAVADRMRLDDNGSNIPVILTGNATGSVQRIRSFNNTERRQDVDLLLTKPLTRNLNRQLTQNHSLSTNRQQGRDLTADIPINQPQGFFNPITASRQLDQDNDGLTDLAEINIFRTNPLLFDSDGDFLPDGTEVRTQNLQPLQADDNQADLDNDGSNNLTEVIRGTRLDLADTDGDGVGDTQELLQRSNAQDPLSRQPVSDSNFIKLRLTVGDHSGSSSERYNLKVGDIVHQAPEFGVVTQAVYEFQKGKTYTISIEHRGTNISDGRPDYDYTALIDALSASDLEAITVSDPSRILGVYNGGSSGLPFSAQGKTATLCIGSASSKPSPKAQSIIQVARATAQANPTKYLLATDWDGKGGLDAPSYKCNLVTTQAKTAEFEWNGDNWVIVGIRKQGN